MPALRTSSSTAPSSRSTRANAASTDPGEVTSSSTPSTPSSSGARRSPSATRAPWSRSVSAMQRPMPRPPPVTNATRPSSFTSSDTYHACASAATARARRELRRLAARLRVLERVERPRSPLVVEAHEVAGRRAGRLCDDAARRDRVERGLEAHVRLDLDHGRVGGVGAEGAVEGRIDDADAPRVDDDLQPARSAQECRRPGRGAVAGVDRVRVDDLAVEEPLDPRPEPRALVVGAGAAETEL